jgi:hypothetical protein
MLRKICWGALLAAVTVFAASGFSPMTPPASNGCSRVGTWHGLGDSGTSWIAIDSPGANATSGQLALEWVSLDPTFGGFFPTADRATGAQGVWQKVNQHTYQYTWIAYVLDAGGSAVFVARASGIASMTDCDHMDLTYALEVFDPSQDISTEPPLFGTYCGTATETRMALVQATCP